MVNPCYCPKSSGSTGGICLDCGGKTNKSEKKVIESKVQIKKTDLDVAKEIDKEKVKKKKVK